MAKTKIVLFGVDALRKKIKLSAELHKFTDAKSRLSVFLCDNQESLRLVTTQATYYLKKHPSQNYFQANCSGSNVKVHLKAVSGWITYE